MLPYPSSSIDCSPYRHSNCRNTEHFVVYSCLLFSPASIIKRIHITQAYYAEVAAAYEAGLINGMADGRFALDEPVSREIMAALLVRAYQYVRGTAVDHSETALQKDFVDGAMITGWAEDEVRLAWKLDLMHGKGGERFAPQDSSSRMEAVQAISNLLQQLER